MISAEKLHKLYLSKRAYFSDQLSDNNNKVVQDKLMHCTFTVDLCLHTFVELSNSVKSLPDLIQLGVDKSSQANDLIIKELDKLVSEIDNLSDQNIENIQISLAEALMASHKERLEMECTIVDINVSVVSLSIQSSLLSLPPLLESNDVGIVVEAIKKLVLNVFSILPGGGVVPGLFDVYKIITARKDRSETTNDYLGQLDDFLELSYAWCLSTQVLVDIIDNFDGLQDTNINVIYDKASKKLCERFNQIAFLST